MNQTRIATLALVVATAAVTLLAGPANADTIAADNPPVVLAQDTTPPPASVPATVVGIDADVVNGLTVTGHGGRRVTASAPGQRTRTVTEPANQPAVLRNLAPGLRYTVVIGGTRVGTGVPVAAVAGAYGLTVSTTGTADEVLLRWNHTPAKAQGAASFDVTATPIAAIGRAGSTPVISGSTSATVTTMALDPGVRYTLSVTPRNSAGTGQATAATMARTLAEMGGASAVPATPAPAPAPAPAPPAADPSPAPAPAPAPAPGPAPGPSPSTKTIYVCPAGFPENSAGVCEKQTPYTFTTTAYTYHPENIYGYGHVDWAYSWGYCTGEGKSGNWSNGDPYCQTPVYGNNAVIGTQNVKDATPAGSTDTGSGWTRKDPLPAGYADNGTAWVQTTAKVATVVPA